MKVSVTLIWFACLKAESFQYILPAQEITAPEMLCFSGDGTKSSSKSDLCPNSVEEIQNYPAMLMDEKGHVIVKLKQVIMRDDGRRRSQDTRKLQQDHYMQLYLMLLEDYQKNLEESKCCYEYFLLNKTFPKSCLMAYRHNADRSSPMASLSPPFQVNGLQKLDVTVKLRPIQKGKHIVIISNCAAEFYTDPLTYATLAKGIKAVFQEVEINFVSQYGELPLSMMGIIPFYFVLSLFYFSLNLIWWKHLTKKSLLGLQRAIHLLLITQVIFCTVAFYYYIHLNLSEKVDIHVLNKGTAAALLNWSNPFSVIVSLAHFITIFGCQCVVTLATDGTWLISLDIKPFTKYILGLMGIGWLGYFLLYSFLEIETRRLLLFLGALLWLGFLFYNIHNSLRHLKSLMVGCGTDHVLAIGGALIAKRSLYRKMCIIIGVYPLLFFISLLYTNKNNQDSYAWFGYVFGDFYLFILFVHASYYWIPRSMAGQEYIKYAPLNASVDDSAEWEEYSEQDSDLELEIS